MRKGIHVAAVRNPLGMMYQCWCVDESGDLGDRSDDHRMRMTDDRRMRMSNP